MKYLKIFFLFFILLIITSCSSDQYLFDRKPLPGVIDNQFVDVITYIDTRDSEKNGNIFRIIREDNLIYLYQNNNKFSNTGFKQIISVDSFLLENNFVSNQEEMSLIFLCFLNDEITILNGYNNDLVIKVPSKIIPSSINKIGFFAGEDGNLSFYDFSGNILGEGYSKATTDYSFIENYEYIPNPLIKRFICGIKEEGIDLFIDKNKISINEKIHYDYLNSIFYQYKEDYTNVIKVNSNFVNNYKQSEAYIINGTHFFFDSSKNSYFTYIGQDYKLYIDLKGDIKDLVFNKSKNIYSYYEQNRKRVTFFNSSTNKEYAIHSFIDFEVYNNIYIFKYTDKMVVTYNGHDIYTTTSNLSLSDIQLYNYKLLYDLSPIYLITDIPNNKVVYIYKDIVSEITIDSNVDKISFAYGNALYLERTDLQTNQVKYSVFNPTKVFDTKDVKLYNSKIYIEEMYMYIKIDNTIELYSDEDLINGLDNLYFYTLNLPKNYKNLDIYELKYSYFNSGRNLLFSFIDKDGNTNYPGAYLDLDENLNIVTKLFTEAGHSYIYYLENNLISIKFSSFDKYYSFEIGENEKFHQAIAVTNKAFFIFKVNNSYKLYDETGKIVIEFDEYEFLYPGIIKITVNNNNKVYDLVYDKYLSTKSSQIVDCYIGYYTVTEKGKVKIYNRYGKEIISKSFIKSEDSCIYLVRYHDGNYDFYDFQIYDKYIYNKNYMYCEIRD